MTDEPPLEESLVQSIRLIDLRDAVVDVAEAGLDQLLVDGPARDVPVLGTLIRLGATLGVVRDHLFARKVAKFLLRVSEIPGSERDKFISGLSVHSERKRLGEILLLMLDRLDDMRKPDILAMLFREYLRGQLDLPTLQRLSRALEMMNCDSLPLLRAFYATSPPEPGAPISNFETLQDLAMCGLVRLEFGGGFGAGSGRFIHGELGKRFVEITRGAA
jgi:hypothetical protein